MRDPACTPPRSVRLCWSTNGVDAVNLARQRSLPQGRHQSETRCAVSRGANSRKRCGSPSPPGDQPKNWRATGPRNGGHQPKNWTGTTLCCNFDCDGNVLELSGISSLCAVACSVQLAKLTCHVLALLGAVLTLGFRPFIAVSCGLRSCWLRPLRLSLLLSWVWHRAARHSGGSHHQAVLHSGLVNLSLSCVVSGRFWSYGASGLLRRAQLSHPRACTSSLIGGEPDDRSPGVAFHMEVLSLAQAHHDRSEPPTRGLVFPQVSPSVFWDFGSLHQKHRVGGPPGCERRDGSDGWRSQVPRGDKTGGRGHVRPPPTIVSSSADWPRTF